MFVAGRQSPWWVSGLSGFYDNVLSGDIRCLGRHRLQAGIVALSINLCYVVATLLVGYFVAGRWRQLGVTTPAEYIQLRFGRAAIHFYTWSIMVYRLVGMLAGSMIVPSCAGRAPANRRRQR